MKPKSLLRFISLVSVSHVAISQIAISQIAISQIAFAQSHSNPKQSARETEELDGSSAENRKKIMASAGMELYFGYSYVLGYQIKPDLNLELWYDTLDYIRLFGGCAYSVSASSTFTGARGRFYFGNSFNVSGYSYYRREKYICEIGHRVATDSNGTQTQITSGSSMDKDYAALGVGFSLGNRWQWENFYIGGEWFGLGLDTVVKNYRSNKASNGAKLILSRLTIGASI